jgi:hypothetical protein
MPERVDAPYPFYVWDQVLDGTTWRCTRPADFRVQASTFAAYARKEARNRGLVVDIKIESEDAVVVRARKGGVQPGIQVVGS